MGGNASAMTLSGLAMAGYGNICGSSRVWNWLPAAHDAFFVLAMGRDGFYQDEHGCSVRSTRAPDLDAQWAILISSKRFLSLEETRNCRQTQHKKDEKKSRRCNGVDACELV